MKWLLVLLVALLVILHQDFWNWSKVDPLVGGFLPIGLAYHALFCLVASLLLGLFVVVAWPKHLEDAQPETPEAKKAEGFPPH